MTSVNVTSVIVTVTGTVQGVGFRPYVYRLATLLGLDGDVANGATGVAIRLLGPFEDIDEFVRRLRQNPPPLARIASATVAPLPAGAVLQNSGFAIVASDGKGTGTALVPPDVAICADCLREMRDPTDRRFRHPFINCTNCGPRFTIVRTMPYDRHNTTMGAFTMCDACAVDYADPSNRRFHAEPICCLSCGPRLTFTEFGHQHPTGDDETALAQAALLLRSGGIAAIKALGGYQLAVLAGNERAVLRLRERKLRHEKPFAVMGADIGVLREFVDLDDGEALMLQSNEAPIVLATRRIPPDLGVCAAVAPESRVLGVMLPSTGLHHLVLELVGAPLVMTSGNVSDEPIVFDDNDARARLPGIADAILSHDRVIHRRADDSVARHRTVPTILRRARGYALRPIALPSSGPPVLAVGAELKSTVCLARGSDAFVSPHLGDLEFVDTYTSFTQTIADLEGLLHVRSELVAHDLHPEYLSTKWAHAQTTPTIAVQHHHAHIASCMVDNATTEPVIGVAFDGHGFGPDGSLWGGEFLVADLTGYRRAAHLATVAVPGGTTAIREPWRMAVAHLVALFGADIPPEIPVLERNCAQWADVAALARRPTALQTSSMGRLFDAVAAILGIRDRSSFEGQAAMALEQAARTHSGGGSDTPRGGLGPIEVVVGNDLLELNPGPMLRSLLLLMSQRNASIGALALGFHACVADAVCAVAERLRTQTSLDVVALTGGVFQNELLVGLTRAQLVHRNFRVLVHRQVPANDGGISLGQAAVARDRLAAGGVAADGVA